jgi:hypothetical protein
MEKYIWSLDLSTTNVGSSLWNSEGKLIEMKHLALTANKDIPKETRDIHKANNFKNYCVQYKQRIENELNGIITNIIIEEPIGGSNNAFTVALLHAFNGMSRYILHEIFGVYPIKISVSDSRKSFLPEFVHTEKKKGILVEVMSWPAELKDDKKEAIRKKVARLEPHIEWMVDKNGKLKDTNFDLSDSYCVGYAGLKLLGIIK